MNDRTLLCHGKEVEEESFRPQQGLTIMNKKMKIINDRVASFRPQQGLTIMNDFGSEYYVILGGYVSVPNRG